MKINPIIAQHAKRADKLAPVVQEEKSVERLDELAQHVADDLAAIPDTVLFPASDKFKHMLTLIARDNPMLYNRIVSLE